MCGSDQMQDVSGQMKFDIGSLNTKSLGGEQLHIQFSLG